MRCVLRVLRDLVNLNVCLQRFVDSVIWCISEYRSCNAFLQMRALCAVWRSDDCFGYRGSGPHDVDTVRSLFCRRLCDNSHFNRVHALYKNKSPLAIAAVASILMAETVTNVYLLVYAGRMCSIFSSDERPISFFPNLAVLHNKYQTRVHCERSFSLLMPGSCITYELASG